MSNKKDESLEIYLNGRIDKDNVAEIEESIKEMLVENEHSKLTLDMSDLVSISEEGLKMLKSLGEKSNNIELKNVTDGIYEVFEKSGLTSIMPISKKLKLEF